MPLMSCLIFRYTTGLSLGVRFNIYVAQAQVGLMKRICTTRVTIVLPVIMYREVNIHM